MSDRPRRAVRNILKNVQYDDSDIDFDDSSEDEYTPSKSDKENMSDYEDGESSEDDDEPLLTMIRKKNKQSAHKQTDKGNKQKPVCKREKKVLSEQDQNAQESDESDDNIPLVHLTNAEIENDRDLQETLANIDKIWESKELNTENIDFAFKGDVEEPPADALIDSPYNYFKKMITDDMIGRLEYQTNLYVLQKDGIELNTTRKEIEILIGIYLRMGLVSMPRVRAYWESFSRFPAIADKMSRNRFEKLASSIHITNNLTATEKDKEDKLWKIRPWLSALRSQFLKIPAEEFNSVDEIMVPFKGKSSLKQYIRGKPNPWGFKLWGRAGASGVLYDFDVYQGKATGKADDSIGVGGDIVLKMCESLPEGKNYKIFADNFFTSLPLVTKLKEKSFHFIGTVRSNRLKGCDFKTEKELKREGRGSYDSKIHSGSNVVAIRWYDNKAVDLVSTYVGAEPVGQVHKEYVNVNRPAIVETYNAYMGGVDLMDSLSALYKQRMKSRRWYMYIFWHTIIIAVVNGWLYYKRHCKLLNSSPMKLCDFASDVAQGLVDYKAKVGRPLVSSPPVKPPTNRPTKRPTDVVRKDGANHIPIWDEKRQRCKLSGCDGFTYVKCFKCNMHLCFNKDRNCFATFHF